MTEPIQNEPTGPGTAGPAGVTSLEQLIAARQAMGLGASDIASRMGMATRQIEALERGDWDRLPGQAFVRAALRAYGKAVGVDVEPLLTTIGGQPGVPELRAAASLESPIPRGSGAGAFSPGGRLGWIVLGLAAVLAIVFYFGPAFEPEAGAPADTALAGADAVAHSGDGQPAHPPGDASAGAAPLAAPPASTLDTPAPAGTPAAGQGGAVSPAALPALAPLVPLAPAAAAGSATGGPDSAATVAGSPPAGPAGSANAAGTPAEAGSAAGGDAGNRAIRLRFGAESWVEIREAGGRVLLTGLQAAGTERVLDGRRPLALVIGNAEHVTLEQGGQPVELRGRIRQGVARLTID